MKYNIGDIVECKVTGIEAYGIFVSIDNIYDGLIHISEISEGFVRNVNDFVKPDEIIKANIIDISDNKKHLKLSIKNIDYRDPSKMSQIEDSAHGFELLKEQLPFWTKEKINEIESED